jgi:hypothetical protein
LFKARARNSSPAKIMVIPGFLWRRIHHRVTEFAEFGEFLIKNSLLSILRASAVQSPSRASQESLETQNNKPEGPPRAFSPVGIGEHNERTSPKFAWVETPLFGIYTQPSR